jgi:hypothetical protein
LFDFAFDEPPQKPASRNRKPKSDDPRIRDITSRIGAVFHEVTGEPMSFKTIFPKRLKDFLSGWPGTADEWLDTYRDVLNYSQNPYGAICRKGADPENLCLMWNSAKAEIAKIRSDESRQSAPKPTFKS